MKLYQSTQLALVLIASMGLASAPLQALEAERTFFRRSPNLLDAYSTFSERLVNAAKYHFIFYLPETAGESLEKVTIQQRQGFEKIKFQPERTFAFVGQPNNRQQAIEISRAFTNPETQEIHVIFARPIPPGTTFTVSLKPRRNPRYGGVYIFGVRAFPCCSQSIGNYLGVGRLHFYGGEGGGGFD